MNVCACAHASSTFSTHNSKTKMYRRAMSRHSPSTALLALGCLLTIYYIQHMFKQYFNFQLQRFVIVDPTTEPTITTLSPTTLRSTTVTATQTPTQPHAQSADLFYSFRGNSKHLYPQQHDNLFVGESKEEFTARFAQWQSRIHNLPFGGPQAHFSAWPVAFETPTLLVRSAFALTDVLYVSIALSKPPTAKRVWSLLPSTSWDNSPKLPFSSCKLVFMTHEGDEAIVANCTVNSNMSYNDRMLITLDRKYLDLDPNKQWVFSLVSGGKSFILPIERIPKRQEKQPNQVHFCTQGILYTELQYGPMPDDHYEAFIDHYASFGVTDLHLYTNSSAHATHAILQSARLVARNMRVWIHDTALPVLAVPRPTLDAVENGFQLFAINDCLHRAYAMGATAVMYGDLDEYSFPRVHEQGLLISDYLAKELAALGSSKSDDAVVLYQTSYIFNTLYCENSTAKYITDRYTVSMLDMEAYAGRRKGIFVYNQVDANTLVTNIHLSVHDASGAVQTHGARFLHLHHYREGWHSNVCSHNASEAQPPWDNTSHAHCNRNLRQ